MDAVSKLAALVRLVAGPAGFFGLVLVAAAQNVDDTAAPKQDFLSSVSQAFKQNFDHEVIRGHFDVGTPPNAKRYYCLVDINSGKRQPNGVSGQPVPRPDGMTGIKATAVSLYTCDSADSQGNMKADEYLLKGGAAKGAVAASHPSAVAPAAVPAVAPVASVTGAAGRVDVAGVRLGMNIDEARAVLKSKKLLNYRESSQATIRDAPFVDVIAAWTPGDRGESFELLFTPIPGRERVVAVIHSTAYAATNALSEATLAAALIKKYGGYTSPAEVSAAPTWRIQSDGTVAVGDACARRGVVGGLATLDPTQVHRANPSLTLSVDEFRTQIERCGIALITEDHAIVGAGGAGTGIAVGGAQAGGSVAGGAGVERMIARYTVTAYSPSIGLDGAIAAAQLLKPAAEADAQGSPRRKEQPSPNL